MEALENRLRRAEALLRTVLPDAQWDDQQSMAGTPSCMQSQIKQEVSVGKDFSMAADSPREGSRSARGTVSEPSENLLESMVDKTGSLDLDDQGNWDYHGQSSGLVYLRCLREQFGDLMGKAEGYGMPFLKTCNISSPANASRRFNDPLAEQDLPNVKDLPPRECAQQLCESALNDACAIVRIVHLPTFWASFNRAYDLSPEQYQYDEHRFLPLLYVVLSLGAVFAKGERSHLQTWGYENAIEQG